jgi:beta-phosphoglucomutase-like phosphatase (HAD superfamily)/thiamine kinase-like enzyme
MITIGKKKILEYLLDFLHLSKHPEDNIFIIYHSLMINLKEWISIKYSYITLIEIDLPTSGPVETILKGLNSNKIQDLKTLLLDCDAFYSYDIISTCRLHQENAVFYFNEHENSKQFSYIKMNDDSSVIHSIKEKENISPFACTGAYLFRSSSILHHYCNIVLDNNIRFKNEFYTSCLIQEMIKEGHIFNGKLVNRNHVTFLGTPEQARKFLDGTLVNTDSIYLKVWTHILKDIEMNEEIFHKHIQGNDDKTVMQFFNPNIQKEILLEISELKDKLFLKHISEVKPISGSTTFIRQLFLEGHDIFIVTNCNRQVAEKILDILNINSFLNGLIIGNECDYPKPYPDPYQKAISLSSDKNKDKCIIFEDSKAGLLSAKGVFPRSIVGIQTGMTELELLNNGANIVITNYDSLDYLDILKESSNIIKLLKKNILHSMRHKNILDLEINNNKLKGGYIADIIEITLLSENNIYKAVFKYENIVDSMLNRMANKLNLYKREYYFYEKIQKYLNIIKTPRSFGIVYSKEDHSVMGILLEDLKDRNVISFTATFDNIDLSLKIIKRLAAMHSQFWNADFKNLFPLLPKNNDDCFKFQNEFIKERWDIFKNKWSYLLNPKQMKIGDSIVDRFIDIQNELSEGDLTLCHGDVKYGNILFQPQGNCYEPYFIDWQYVSIGKGIQDVIFFMIESYDRNILKLYKNILIQYYYTELLRNGIKYPYDTFMKDLHNATRFTPFFVAIWFGCTPREDLIDINFPYFYIQKLFAFLEDIEK